MIEPGRTYYLSRAVEGPYSGKQYGAAGDGVVVLSIHNTMVILEKSKVRFPAKLDCLTDAKVEADPASNPTSSPIGKPSTRKHTKKSKTKSSSLF